MAVLPEDLEDPDKAGILYFKATTTRECGLHGLPRAIDIIRKAVLLHPEEVRWTLKLMQYEGYKRRMIYRTDQTDLSSLETIIATADSILELPLEPKTALKFKYEQFQAFNDFLKTSRNANGFPWHEKKTLLDKCTNLAEEIVRKTDRPRHLSNCAQFLAYDKQNIERAVEIIEQALKQSPLDTYINGKASNVYRKANKMDKALKCAEVAAEVSIGSYLQILQLKIALGHPFDLRQFFAQGLTKYYQPWDKRLLYVSGLIHLACFTNHFKQAVEYFKLFLDSEPPEHDVCEWVNNKSINVGEAAYYLVLYVLSGDVTFKDDEFNMEEDKDLFEEVKEKIQEKYDVRAFRDTTPKKYVEWMKEGKVSNLPKRAFFSQSKWRQEPENERSSSRSFPTKSQYDRQRQSQPTNWRQECRSDPPTAESSVQTQDVRQTSRSFNWRQERRAEPPSSESSTDWRKELHSKRSTSQNQPAQLCLSKFKPSAQAKPSTSSWARKFEESEGMR